MDPQPMQLSDYQQPSSTENTPPEIHFPVSPDHSAQKKLEAQTYKRIFENAVEGFFVTTPQGQYIDVNPALAKIYGFTEPKELIAYFADIKQQLYLISSRRDEFIQILEQNGEVAGFESQVRKKDGEVIWITENARAMHDAQGNLEYYAGTVMDISDRKSTEAKLEIQQNYFSQLFANSPQAIAIMDRNRSVVRCNLGFKELFGYSTLDILNTDLQHVIVSNEFAEESELLWQRILAGETIECETQRRDRKGNYIPVSLIGFPIFFNNEIHGITLVYKDISERKSFEQQIIHQAFHDDLTGLPNRSYLNRKLQGILTKREERRKHQAAILLLDLDKFKSVNDTLGHPAGDEILIEVSKRLAACIRSKDTVTRLGGDEFAIVLGEITSKRTVLHVAERIHASLSDPFFLGNHQVFLQASTGILMDIYGYTSPDDILRDVDIAMYQAKHQGKLQVIYDSHMHQELLDSTNLESELRDAVLGHGFSVYYQPILAIGGKKIVGFEALLRWNNPDRGMVPPSQFIPVAEETGLIIELGQWVIEEACRTLSLWRTKQKDAEDLSINVNVSVRQFEKPGLVEFIAATLEEFYLPPKCLKVEITETMIMDDASSSIAKLNALRQLGVQIALDDFGTGYSSLSYIHKLPIDVLKIDRSFINNLGQQEENTPIVQSIITLAKILGVTVVAEGVETKEQLHKLQELQCDTAQGFLFSPPVDVKKAENLLHEYSKSKL